jgi:hypothetical protein
MPLFKSDLTPDEWAVLKAEKERERDQDEKERQRRKVN